jgi:hypothetical protein
MYITTPLGSLIPLQNVAAITPSKSVDGGSVLRLTSGQNIKDPRSPKEVFAEVVPVDTNPVIALIIESLEDMKNSMSTKLMDLEALVLSSTLKINKECDKSTVNLGARAYEIRNASKKLNVDLDEIATLRGLMIKDSATVSQVITKLEEAIGDCNL